MGARIGVGRDSVGGPGLPRMDTSPGGRLAKVSHVDKTPRAHRMSNGGKAAPPSIRRKVHRRIVESLAGFGDARGAPGQRPSHSQGDCPVNPMLIRGLGTAVPHHWIAQEDAATIAQLFHAAGPKAANAVSLLYRRAGVQSRHSVVLDSSTNGDPARQSFYPAATSTADRGPVLSERMQRFEQTAGQLAVAAARRALGEAEVDPQHITHLITVSCTGFAAPGFDLELCRELPLPGSVAQTQIGFMGCHAMLNALRVAHAITAANPAAVLLVCAVELCSLHHQYGRHANRIVANSLFADGAAATVCSAQLPSTRADWRLLANGSVVIPNTLAEMTWKIGDHGFEMSLSARVPDIIRAELRDWMQSWLAEQGLTLNEVRRWAVHPGGPRILDAVQDALGLEPVALTASREVLSDYGNMSSPTVMFILERLGTMCGEGPCVMVGFGPGLAIEAALLA